MSCPIRAIVFDVYGTLISTGTGSVEAAREILARNRREAPSPQDFYRRWKALHRAHMDQLEDAGNFLWEEDIFLADLDQLYREYGMGRSAKDDGKIMLKTLGKRQAFPESREVLEHLARRFVLAIGSTTDTAPLLADLERGGLKVSQVFTSESLRCYKPRLKFYQAILKGLGVPGQHALFVGDSLTDDVAGPKRAGMKTCWVNRKGQPSPLGEEAPDFEISSLKELPEILEGRST